MDITQPVFLATTSLEEFWETSQPLLFLGEWCRRYSRKSFWEPLDGRTLESQWKTTQSVNKAYDYVNKLYERLIIVLTQEMNRFHEVEFSERYWRILLGPWLLYYLSVVYDRYTSIRNALDHYPDFDTTVLSAEDWITPVDTLEYVQLIKDDPFNLQIYSRILKTLGKEFPQKNFKVEATNLYPKKNLRNWKDLLKDSLRNKLVAYSKKKKGCRFVMLRYSNFSMAVEMIFFLKSGGRIFPLLGDLQGQAVPERDLGVRRELACILSADTEFEKILNEMLPLDIPSCFVEGYTQVCEDSQRFYPEKPTAIFSANAWYFDEPFKQWSAQSAETGTYLLGMQHGGNYGSLRHHSSENHEITIADRYFTWGWSTPSLKDKLTPKYAAKLTGRKPIGADNRNDGILFVSTAMPKYLIQFPHIPEHFDEYLLWQSTFVDRTHPDLKQCLRVRLHREDMGWDLEHRWHDLHPEVFLEGWEITFMQSLTSCRLYVCDQLSTTFLEALSVDKPTILFWNPEHNELRPEAQPYYDQLRSVGILYDNPESAAEAVNSVYGDVESWWNDSALQAVLKNFCARFAQTSEHAVNDWVAEFKTVKMSKAASSMDRM